MKNDRFAQINLIGNEMVACQRACRDVYSDRAQGSPPRGLVRVSRDPDTQGAVLLGMNPGQGDDRERAALQADPSYGATVRFMETERLPKHPYYKRVRSLIDSCELSGDLIWTELAKCQNAPGVNGSLPIETNRTCSKAFLRREVEITPPTWGIFAIGRDAYRAATFMFLDRAILGVPHPTGSRGPWYAMFEDGILKPEVRQAVERILTSRRAAWIPEEVATGL